jgi:hypothetical protein
MIGVCLAWPTNEKYRDQWAYILSNFAVDNVWVVGCPDSYCQFFPGAVFMDHQSELPDYPIVVCQPPDARYVKGEINLMNFSHPEHAIYVFGLDNNNLSEDDLKGEPDYKVFIPTAKNEMWSWVAAAVVLYDRASKG